jgi:centromeric protein E
MAPSKLRPPLPTAGGAPAAFSERQQNKGGDTAAAAAAAPVFDSPVKIEMSRVKGHPSLLEQMPEDEWSMMEDMSFDEKDFKAGSKLRSRDVLLGGKENMPA